MSFSPNSSTSVSLDLGMQALTTEFSETFREIRNVHDMRVKFFTILMSCVVTLTGYALAGAWLYLITQSKDKVTPIPMIVVYSYGALGLVLTGVFYLILFNVFNYIGPNKKHLVRYWKSIHSLRNGMARIAPSTRQHFLFPTTVEVNRPRISGRWDLGVLIYPLFNCFTYVLAVIFTAPCLADKNGFLNFDSENTRALSAAGIIWCFPFVFGIACGNRPMRDYLRNLKEGRKLTADNVFWRQRPKRETLRTRYNLLHLQMAWIVAVFIYWFAWMVLYSSSRMNAPSVPGTLRVVGLVILGQLLLTFRYLALHDLLSPQSVKSVKRSLRLRRRRCRVVRAK
jgi:hypothetical protein